MVLMKMTEIQTGDAVADNWIHDDFNRPELFVYIYRYMYAFMLIWTGDCFDAIKQVKTRISIVNSSISIRTKNWIGRDFSYTVHLFSISITFEYLIGCYQGIHTNSIIYKWRSTAFIIILHITACSRLLALAIMPPESLASLSRNIIIVSKRVSPN